MLEDLTKGKYAKMKNALISLRAFLQQLYSIRAKLEVHLSNNGRQARSASAKQPARSKKHSF
jgi:hypothetical protein